MNKRRTDNWTTIDIPGDDTGNDTSTFELNLNEETPTKTNNKQVEPNEDEDLLENVREESQDSRRPVLTVSKNQENQNRKTRTEVEEDQEERTVQNRQTRVVNDSDADNEEDSEANKRNNRAHKRIQTLHRRATEAEALLARERQEKAELRKQLALTQRKSAETSRDSYKAMLDSAEQDLEKAIQENDAPKIAKLTKAIADTTMRYNAYQAVSEEIEEPEEEQPVQQAPQGFEAARTWLKRNPKFLNDRVFHVNARLISEDLTREGLLDPNDDEYWEELDNRLKKTLKIEEEQPKNNQNERSQPRRTSPVGSRNDEDSETFPEVSKQFKRQGNRIQANPTTDDVDIAEKLGISLEDMMKEKYKYAKQGYKGYVEIEIPGQK